MGAGGTVTPSVGVGVPSVGAGGAVTPSVGAATFSVGAGAFSLGEGVADAPFVGVGVPSVGEGETDTFSVGAGMDVSPSESGISAKADRKGACSTVCVSPSAATVPTFIAALLGKVLRSMIRRQSCLLTKSITTMPSRGFCFASSLPGVNRSSL